MSLYNSDFYTLTTQKMKNIENNLEDFNCLCNTADKQGLYEYLDAFSFVNTAEVFDAVCEYFRQFWNSDGNLSYWDIALCTELADKYMADRDMDYLEDSNLNWEY